MPARTLFAVSTSGTPKSPQTSCVVCGSAPRRPECAQTEVPQTQTTFVSASRSARKPQTTCAGPWAGACQGGGNAGTSGCLRFSRRLGGRIARCLRFGGAEYRLFASGAARSADNRRCLRAFRRARSGNRKQRAEPFQRGDTLLNSQAAARLRLFSDQKGIAPLKWPRAFSPRKKKECAPIALNPICLIKYFCITLN